MLVVCLLGAAARRQEQLRDSAGAEQHAGAKHDLRREEPVPHRTAGAVLVEFVGQGHAEIVIGQAGGDFRIDPSAKCVCVLELVD